MIKPDNMEEREEAARLYMEWHRLKVELENAREDGGEADEEFRALDARENAAWEAAYENHPLALMTNYEGDEILRCGACKAPLIEDDELVEDAYTGELFLRSALGLPPREDKQVLPDLVEAS